MLSVQLLGSKPHGVPGVHRLLRSAPPAEGWIRNGRYSPKGSSPIVTGGIAALRPITAKNTAAKPVGVGPR